MVGPVVLMALDHLVGITFPAKILTWLLGGIGIISKKLKKLTNYITYVDD